MIPLSYERIPYDQVLAQALVDEVALPTVAARTSTSGDSASDSSATVRSLADQRRRSAIKGKAKAAETDKSPSDSQDSEAVQGEGDDGDDELLRWSGARTQGTTVDRCSVIINFLRGLL